MKWYEYNPELFDSESSYIRRTFPDVNINIEKGRVILRGAFPANNEHGITLRTYRLEVVFPKDYPDWIPTVFMREPGVQYKADRHIFNDGRACFCLPHEIPILLASGITFEAFHQKLFQYWLLGQVGYDRCRKWPFPAWRHSAEGIIDAYSEITGFKTKTAVENFMGLLVRKNPAKGHERCPCGSGLRLRKCHEHLYHSCRSNLPKHAFKKYHSVFR